MHYHDRKVKAESDDLTSERENTLPAMINTFPAQHTVNPRIPYFLEGASGQTYLKVFCACERRSEKNVPAEKSE